MTAGNDDNSLSLSNSALDINRNTDAIAVLDDNNGRIIVFNQSTNATLFNQSTNSALLNQSNSSTLFIIALDSSNLTNISTAYNRTSIMAYSGNGSMYIVDGLSNEIMKINNPLDFGENVTSVYNLSTTFNYLLSNLTARGLCVDNTEEIFLYLIMVIIRFFAMKKIHQTLWYILAMEQKVMQVTNCVILHRL